MKLLPKSSLDSSHLEGDTKRRRGHLRKVVRSQSCSLKESREEEEGVRERECPMPQLPAIQAEQVADDVAPVTAEYVPAKARDDECG